MHDRRPLADNLGERFEIGEVDPGRTRGNGSVDEGCQGFEADQHGSAHGPEGHRERVENQADHRRGQRRKAESQQKRRGQGGGSAETGGTFDEGGEHIANDDGLDTAVAALFLKTAKLPRVELFKPERIVAKNTMDNIRVGMVIGYIGLIEKLIDEVVKEMNFDVSKLKVVATGGYSSLITKDIDKINIIDKKLTLDGMLEIYKMKKGL